MHYHTTQFWVSRPTGLTSQSKSDLFLVNCTFPIPGQSAVTPVSGQQDLIYCMLLHQKFQIWAPIFKGTQ